MSLETCQKKLSEDTNISKKINTAESFKELANIINEGFINLTGANACWCWMIDTATNHTEVRKIKYTAKFDENQIIEVKEIRQTVLDLFENFELEDIDEYIETVSKNNKILLPITYKSNTVGYFGMISNNSDFNEQYIEIVKIIAELINCKFELILNNEDKEKSLKERTEFLASISHEFKTPLNSIIGFTDILSENETDVQNTKFLENISQSSLYLMELIQSILDYSRSENKPFDLKIEKFRPKQIIENIIDNFEEIRKEKNIIFNYTLSDIFINGDMIKLKQVMFNLISNALKFSKENSVISLVTYINEKQEFIFEIKDSGEGISKKDLGKIFNFFTQVNRGQLKRQQGSGIGLALCRKILQAHGGDIYVKSKLHQGSTFRFSIPIEPKN